MTVEIICTSCKAVGAVNKVTAGLRCSCGSADLDLFEPTEAGFLDFMGAAHGPGTGWGHARPDGLNGWNEYAGPMPGPNPWSNHDPIHKCPVCKGSGQDLRDNRMGQKCRECGGTGEFTPNTTAEAPLVRQHNYPSTQTSTPFMGRHAKQPSPEEVIRATTPGYTNKSMVTPPPTKADSRSPMMSVREDRDYSQPPAGPYTMEEAHCPFCGQGNTKLIKDHREHAWWHCDNCGPLADIDGASRDVNPYDPPSDFRREKGFKEARRIGKSKKTGRVLKMLTAVHMSNPGLTKREAVSLAVRTVSKYTE